MSDERRAAKNTDRELWRERDGDFYAHSIHVTANGEIGINCDGTVIVMPLRKWHEAALRSQSAADRGCPICADRTIGDHPPASAPEQPAI